MDRIYQDPTDYTNTQKNHSESLEGEKTNLTSDSHYKKNTSAFLWDAALARYCVPF